MRRGFSIILTVCLLAVAPAGLTLAQSLSERDHAALEQRLRRMSLNVGRLSVAMARCGQSHDGQYRAELISTVARFEIVDRAALVTFVNRQATAEPGDSGTTAEAVRCSPALARVYLERHLLGLGELEAFLWRATRGEQLTSAD